MAYEQRDNSGSFFKNDKKTSDKHPDYKGSAMIGGVEYWVSTWVKTSNSGVKFFSQSFTAKEKRQPGDAPTATSHASDDDLPF